MWPDGKKRVLDVCKHFPAGVPAGREVAHLAECDARILIVGEAPGANEEKKGVPFVGQAGFLLDRDLLDGVGLSRSLSYITNVAPFRPPSNAFETVQESGMLLPFEEEVQRKIKAFHGSVVVPLGTPALHATTGRVGIMKWRGSVLDTVNGILSIGSIHPAAILRQRLLLKTALYDWRRVKEIVENGWTPPAYELVVTSWNDHRLHALESAAVLACDIETIRGTSRVLCISFCADGRTSFSIDCRAGIPPLVRTLLESNIPKILQNGLFDLYILALNGVRVRRFLYDTSLLFHALDNNAGPSTSASSSVDGGGKSVIKPYSLAYMASIFTPFPYWKDSGKDSGDGEAYSGKTNWHRFGEYNAMDSLGTYVIAKVLVRKLKEIGRFEFYKQQYAQLLYPILDLSLRGVRFDVEAADGSRESNQRQLSEMRERLESLAGCDLHTKKVFKKEPKKKEGRKDGLIITCRPRTSALQAGGKDAKGSEPVDDRARATGRSDWDGVDGVEWIGERKSLSNVLLQRHLYDTLKLKRQTKDGHLTSDEVAIRNLLLYVKEKGDGRKRWSGDVERTTDLLNAVLEFRETEKTIQFLSGDAVDEDGRIRAAYGLNVQTGRLRSSGNPAGTGYNLQNIQRNVRHFFVPDDKLGNGTEPVYFLEIDLKQAEDLVVKAISAALTGNDEPLRLVRAVHDGSIDIHKRLASVVFGVRPQDVDYEKRYVAKRCRHARNNGMRDGRMQQILLKDGFVFARHEVKRILAAVDAAEPWVLEFHKAIRRVIMRRGGIATSYGWQLMFDYERLSDAQTFNRGYCFIEQSEVGVLMKQQGLLTYWCDVRPHFHARLNMLVHDNLVLSVPRSELYKVTKILYDALTTPRRYGIFHPFSCTCNECARTPVAEISIPAEVKISKWLSCTCEECKVKPQPLEFSKMPNESEFERRLVEWESGASQTAVN